MQLLRDEGFESGGAWVFTSGQRAEAASSYSHYARNGAWVGELWSTRPVVDVGPPTVWGPVEDGLASQTLPDLPAGWYLCWVWVRQLAPGAELRLEAVQFDSSTVPLTQIIDTVAGNGSTGFSGDGGFPLGRLVSFDGYPLRREGSLACGAHASLDPHHPEVMAQARQWFPEGADLTYEISGAPAALNTAIAVTGFAGRVVVGSWYGQKTVNLDL